MKRLVAATALLASLSVVPLDAGAQSRKKIIPLGVEATDAGIQGSFEVVESPAGIVSTGTGGACLVFSKQRQGGARCRTQEDCKLDREYVEGAAYCVGADQASGNNGRCWVRPAGNYCLRSPTMPNPLDTKIDFPRDDKGALQPVADPMPGWWRVLACLNGKVNGACAGAPGLQKMVRSGPPKRVH